MEITPELMTTWRSIQGTLSRVNENRNRAKGAIALYITLGEDDETKQKQALEESVSRTARNTELIALANAKWTSVTTEKKFQLPRFRSRHARLLSLTEGLPTLENLEKQRLFSVQSW